MAFDELRAFPHDEGGVADRDDASEGGESKATEEMDSAQHAAVELANALLDNPNLKAEDGVDVLLDGLVKTRVGSSVKPPVQLMTSGDREMLGDRIVRWGIEHGDWGTDDEEKAATVVAFDAFVNGSLAALVGPSVEEQRGEAEAEGDQMKAKTDLRFYRKGGQHDAS